MASDSSSQLLSHSNINNNVHFLEGGINVHIMKLEVRGPSGPQLLVGGPAGWLDFVLRALRALRPRLTSQILQPTWAVSWRI